MQSLSGCVGGLNEGINGIVVVNISVNTGSQFYKKKKA